MLRHDGALLVERAVRALHGAGCEPVFVVLGAAADQVRSGADLGSATVVVNASWKAGVASSLRAGLTSLAETEAQAAVVLPVDMPGITDQAVRLLLSAADPGSIAETLVCGTFEGRRNYPMLFGRAHWSGMATLANADVGVRPYLLARSGQVSEVECDQVARPDDLDTPDDAKVWGISLD